MVGTRFVVVCWVLVCVGECMCVWVHVVGTRFVVVCWVLVCVLMSVCVYGCLWLGLGL